MSRPDTPFYYDGDLSTPVLLFEAPFKSIDGTDNVGWDETYIQYRLKFASQAIDTASSRHATCYLVAETKPEPVSAENPEVVRFTRTYCAVPATRTEKVNIAYNYPGLSSGTGAAWNRYGARRPTTLKISGTDTHTYVRASSAPTPDALTQPTFGSEPVDFIGTVYAEEDPWSLLGATSPSTEPATYTIDSEVRLWRGLIWEKITRVVGKPSVYL
jgi:hypothetical protein